MASVQITSSNYNGKAASITFYSVNDPNTGVDLGSQIIPYTRDGNDVYGTYILNFIDYNKICTVSISSSGTTTTTTVEPTTTTTAAPTTTTAEPTTTTTTAAPGGSLPAYFVVTNAAYGGKYCEDGTFDGKPKYRKTGADYYIYWLNPDYGWAISNDLGNINPNVVAANSGGDTPPIGSFAFMDYNTGNDLGVFSSFYSTSATATLSNTYIHFGNTYNGKPKYNLVGGALLAQYESQRAVWAIIDEEIDPGNPVVLYENSSNSNALPLTGWVVADGNSPAPTLTGPNC